MGGSRCRRRRTVGSSPNFVQCAPRSRLAKRPNSVPAKRRLGFFGSSRTTLTGPVGGRSPGDALPGAPEVARPVGERRDLAGAVRLDGEVGDLRVVRRGLDPSHPEAAGLGGKVAVRSVQCAPSSSVTQTFPSSVPGPEQSLLRRRLGQRVHDAVDLGAAAGGGRARRVLCREVGADRGPLLAAVGQAEDAVAAEVQHALLVAAADQRRVPVEAEAGLPLGRRRAQALGEARRQVEAKELALLGLGIDEVGVVGIEDAGEAVAAADVDPVAS